MLERPEDEEETDQVNFRALAGDEKIEKQLPSQLWEKMKQEEAWLYPNTLDDWHGELRGSDEPSADKLTASNRTKATTAKNVCISFSYDDKTHACSIGSVAKPAAGSPDLRCVHLQWITHSQLPGLRFIVKLGGGRPSVHVWFYTNSLKSAPDNQGSPCVSLGNFKGSSVWEMMDRSTGLSQETMHAETIIWETRLVVWSQQEVDEGAAEWSKINRARPQVTGIDQLELNRILAVGNLADKKGDLELLSTPEWALWGLLSTNCFQVYRTWNNSDEASAACQFLHKYMTRHFKNVLNTGDWPHYVRQAQVDDKEIHDFGYDLRLLEPPRNMVKSWRVKYQDGKAIAAEPEKWAAFPRLATYPTMESRAFANRLGIERGRGRKRHALEEFLKDKAGKIKVTFAPLPTINGSYYAEMTLRQPEESIWANLRQEDKPEPGFRINVTITEKSSKWYDLKLAGTVQADVMRTGAELSAVLFQRGGQAIPIDTSLLAAIEVPDDGKPLDRQNAAIYEIANGMDREKGVDIPHLVLGGLPSVHADRTGSLASSIAHSRRARATYESTLGDWGLVGKQLDAALDAYTSKSGLTVIHGPPGCGKTFALMAILHALIAAGKAATPEHEGGDVAHLKRRVMVCASSHSAVDNATNTLLKNLGANHGLQICCFVGSRTTRPNDDRNGGPKDGKQHGSALLKDAGERDEQTNAGGAADLHVNSAGMQSGNNAHFDYIDELATRDSTFGNAVHPELEYHYQRQRFIELHANDRHSPWQQAAIDTDGLRKQLKNRQHDLEMRQKIRDALTAYEDQWTERYWEQIDVVFVTNNSSVHEVLLQHAKPNVLISDEMGQASLADGATPAAGHKEIIQLWIAAGDHHRQSLPDISSGANEMFAEVQVPIFAVWVENQALSGRFGLDLQRRMRPVHSGFVTQTWYQGLLHDDASVLQKPAIEYTLEEAHANLGGYWNQRCRIGVDVSGAGVSSTRADDGHSLQNLAEANMLVEYVRYLLAYDPDRTGSGRRILASDFLIITPYSGQAATIRLLLYTISVNKEEDGSGLEDVKVREVEVMTSSTCHGHEANIVLLSLVRNIPNQALHMGSIRSRQQLCLSFSRVKVHMVVFGNLLALVQGVRNGWKDFSKGNRGETLGLILDDLDKKGDLLSGAHLQALMAGRQLEASDSIY